MSLDLIAFAFLSSLVSVQFMCLTVAYTQHTNAAYAEMAKNGARVTKAFRRARLARRLATPILLFKPEDRAELLRWESEVAA